MHNRSTYFLLATLICVGMLLPADLVRADGGTVRALKRSGPLLITAFTSPPIPTSGAVDISVLVQDAESGSVVNAARVDVCIVPVDRPYAAREFAATSQRATNKLFQDCHAQLDPGRHDIEVRVTHPQVTASLQFQLEVPPPPTKAASFWHWYAWPLVPIALALAHLCYGRSKPRGARRRVAHSASTADESRL